jgi:hypothetical protein
MRILPLAISIVLAAGLAGCGKKEPTVAADPKREQAEALERAKKGAFGTQVNAIESAKTMGDDLNKKAQDAVDKAEKDAK